MRLTQEVIDLKTQLATAQQEKKKANTNQQSLSKLLKAAKFDLRKTVECSYANATKASGLEFEKSKLQAKFDKLKSEQATWTQTKEFLEQQVESLQSTLEQKAKALSSAVAWKTSLNFQIFELNTKLALGNEDFDALFEDHEVLKQEDELMALFKAQAEDLKKQKERFEVDMKKQVDDFRTEKESLESTLSSSRVELSSEDETIAKLRVELEASQKANQELKAIMDEEQVLGRFWESQDGYLKSATLLIQGARIFKKEAR